MQKFDSSYFRGKNYFHGNGTQKYLVFQPMYKYFKTFIENNFTFISSWESNGLSNEKIHSTKTPNYDQSSRIVYDNARIQLNFSGDLLKQDKITYSHGAIGSIYVVYRLAPRTNNSDVTLENCLFGAIIGFDSKDFSFTSKW